MRATTPAAIPPGSSRLAGARDHRPRTAFVLSGAASLAAVQVGMLQALYEDGITPDLLVATSAGAVNAAFIASRPQTTATAQALGRIWRNLQREDMFPVSLSALVGGVCGNRDHLVRDRGLRQLVRRYIEFDDLADASIPLHLVSFDLTTGHEVLLSDGPSVDAVAASGSIPGIYPPVRMGDRRLIDGGVAGSTPISHAVELGAERIYVLPAQHPSQPLARVPKSALDASIYGLGLLIGSRLETDIARNANEAELIVMPTPKTGHVQPTSFEHSGALISQALAAGRRLLKPQHSRRHLRLVTEDERTGSSLRLNSDRAVRVHATAEGSMKTYERTESR
jgi:NTE family protein